MLERSILGHHPIRMTSDLDHIEHRKTTPVPIRPGLSLYRQPKGPGIGSPYWYARARLDVGGRKVHVKSTGTTDLRQAHQRAEEFYTDLCITKRGGPVIAGLVDSRLAERCYRFDVVADSFLGCQLEAARGDERKVRRYKDHRAILIAPNGPCRFFRGTDIRAITTGRVREFLAFAERNSRRGQLRPTTRLNILASLRQVFNFALDEGLLDRVPKMPTVRMRDNPRSSFSRVELERMLTKCCQLTRDASTDAEWRRWFELHDFIVFMVGTFLRPSEWVDLKHSDIAVVEGGSTPHLQIAVSRGKTGKRLVVSMPEAVGAYARIRQRSGNDPSAYLFVKDRASRDGALARMRKSFAELLSASGLEHDQFGSKRVIYSLRHTGLSLRIIEGDKVNPILLARNAGTSVEMLERFYLSRVTPQDDLQNLQSKRS